MSKVPRLLRITTVPISLNVLLKGQLTFMQQQKFEVLAISANGPEREEILKQNINHEVVHMTRSISPIRDLVALIKLIIVCLRFKPHIVHTHTPKAGLLGMLAAWICRVPVRMHTVAGLPLMEATGVKKSVLKVTERMTYAFAHKVYPNSIGLKNYIKSQILKRDAKISIIGNGSSNGIDSNFFSRNAELEKQALEIRNRFDISNVVIVFSFVGRVVKDKGITELLQAFEALDKSLQVRLLLIGPFEDDLDPLPPETIAILKNNSHVIVTGFQHDVRPWIMASDIFVFPSYREGFPNAVMQAACLETPCIVSDINGCNEIIKHNETGIIVPVKNFDSLSNAMLLLAKDKTLRSVFAKNSKEFVAKNFDQQYVWKELLKEYQNALEKIKQ